jgi:hypothetical protein
MLITSRKGTTVITIMTINAVSSLLAAVGIGGYLVREKRRADRAVGQPVFVTTRRVRPRARG